MPRNIWGAALALALAFGSGNVRADDDTKPLGRFVPSSDGEFSRSNDATADDTELVHRGWGCGVHRGWGGYRAPVWGWGVGYSSGWGWNGGWGGYYGWNRGFYSPGFAYSPLFCAPRVYYAPPVFYSAPVYTFWGCSGTSAPTVALNVPSRAPVPSASTPLPTPQPLARPNTFPYEGPKSPVPQPEPDKTEPLGDALAISLKAPETAKPKYQYRAFGQQ